tara:strand:+ start:2203 stop:2559 length:357 start_codon:yes stop_codon:yes gene_type:complete
LKWIGQHIFDLISRFRGDVFFNKKVYDGSDSPGTAGQHLLSTATATAWANKTFTYNQEGSSHTWVITHNLGYFPSVTVVDSGNSVVIGCVTYNSVNQLTVQFHEAGVLSAFSGKAYLN